MINATLSIHTLRGLLPAVGLIWILSAIPRALIAQSPSDDLPASPRAVLEDLQRDTLHIPFNSHGMYWVDAANAWFKHQKIGLELDSPTFFNDRLALPKSAIEQLTGISHGGIRLQDNGGQQDHEVVVDIEQLRRQYRNSTRAFRESMWSRLNFEGAAFEPIHSTWENIDVEPSRIVIVVPGFQSSEKTASRMGEAVFKQASLPAIVFRYPNDVPILESGERLARLLKQYSSLHPETRISIVAHSMGGLVARVAIETPIREINNVERLIQVCPPNHGSILADYAAPLEGIELLHRLGRRSESRSLGPFLSAVTDGFGEAHHDLEGDSAFLRELNSRPRTEQVQYSILAGTGGPLNPAFTGLMNLVWGRVERHVPQMLIVDERVQSLIDADELQRGRGDGVVSLRSAHLDGVSDFSSLPINHLVWNDPESLLGKVLVSAIANRLRGVDSD